MNHLADLEELRKRYFAFRHGKSVANDLGIIVSDPLAGLYSYGLTANGRKQVSDSVHRARQKGILDAETVIMSSDFSRARKTAEIAKNLLSAADIRLCSELLERFFGSWERRSNTHYQDVWDLDAKDPGHTQNGVEAADAVLERTTRLIADLEREFSCRKILLVSHGDALQILQCGFRKISASLHRTLPHLDTAEIRELTL